MQVGFAAPGRLEQLAQADYARVSVHECDKNFVLASKAPTAVWFIEFLIIQPFVN
jgi:hypothetical protein